MNAAQSVYLTVASPIIGTGLFVQSTDSSYLEYLHGNGGGRGPDAKDFGKVGGAHSLQKLGGAQDCTQYNTHCTVLTLHAVTTQPAIAVTMRAGYQQPGYHRGLLPSPGCTALNQDMSS